MEMVEVEYNDITLTVYYLYQPEEKETGTHEAIEIDEVLLDGFGFLELTEEATSDVIDLIIEQSNECQI